MTYGLQILNNNAEVVISDNYPVFQRVSTGAFDASNTTIYNYMFWNQFTGRNTYTATGAVLEPGETVGQVDGSTTGAQLLLFELAVGEDILPQYKLTGTARYEGLASSQAVLNYHIIQTANVIPETESYGVRVYDDRGVTTWRDDKDMVKVDKGGFISAATVNANKYNWTYTINSTANSIWITGGVWECGETQILTTSVERISSTQWRFRRWEVGRQFNPGYESQPARDNNKIAVPMGISWMLIDV